jgi:hypothetical protein
VEEKQRYHQMHEVDKKRKEKGQGKKFKKVKRHQQIIPP